MSSPSGYTNVGLQPLKSVSWIVFFVCERGWCSRVQSALWLSWKSTRDPANNSSSSQTIMRRLLHPAVQSGFHCWRLWKVLLYPGSLLPTVLVGLKRIRQQIKRKLIAERVFMFRSPSGVERVSIQVVQYDGAFQNSTKFPSILQWNECCLCPCCPFGSTAADRLACLKGIRQQNYWS